VWPAFRNVPIGRVGDAVTDGLLYLFPLVASAAGDPDRQRRLRQAGPMDAGLAVQATTGLDRLPIGPWPGLGVLAAWTAASLPASGLALRLRDA
jgi:ABC-2 type transport system permease protein